MFIYLSFILWALYELYVKVCLNDMFVHSFV